LYDVIVRLVGAGPRPANSHEVALAVGYQILSHCVAIRPTGSDSHSLFCVASESVVSVLNL